jgi:hypothetical protein
MREIAEALVRVAKDLVADEKDQKIEAIIKTFDNLEARWQDESEYEDFREYQQVAKKAVQKQGFRFVSLKERPMQLKFKDGGTDYTVKLKGNQIVVEQRG